MLSTQSHWLQSLHDRHRLCVCVYILGYLCVALPAICFSVDIHDCTDTHQKDCLLWGRERVAFRDGEADLISAVRSCHAVGVCPLPRCSPIPTPPRSPELLMTANCGTAGVRC